MQEQDYTALLEKDYGSDPVAQAIIKPCLESGQSAKEIWETLESFY